MVLTKERLPEERGFAVSDSWRRSFGGPAGFFAVSGPGSLVRLVQFGKVTREGHVLDPSSPAGAFWFEEDWLRRLRDEACRELRRQNRESRQTFAAGLGALISLYVRHCLRQDLAICKDWTEDFDAYVRLQLGSQDRLICLVGPVARQAAYSQQHPRHAGVVASQICLPGQATQYLVDFRHPANESFRERISVPRSL